MKEREIIESLREAFPDAALGDDAAVLPGEKGELLVAADAVVEGVHFERSYSTLAQAVQKVITSNVSDIFAMGGKPDSIIFTAGLPKGFGKGELSEIIEGLKKGCGVYRLKLAGGDTVLSSGGLFFNMAILGDVRRGRAVLRRGACEGDTLVLFGDCGCS
ncbi:MAG: hypothetical protein KAX38_08365, partial [Candidatus Krumholzibacteria bacterium]|nr:hypothetical protein [Candidatus Krumholzibacteria bacterium]